ncbi:hypothetical protein RUR79_004183 [Escherichia coli]|nr:hypothetical protein [Escherichia coli]ELR9614068.1 hypothetical protein [Escherichia coli]
MTLAAITMTAPEAASPVQMYRATYSPDDNKLRLYAVSRLDPETYKKVHDAGFRWAPKQALFVAPAWTPGREDVLLSLAGEIEDEDSTLAERQEARAERFTGYSGNMAKLISSHDHISACFPLDTYPRPAEKSQYEGSRSLWSALDDDIITTEQAREIAIRCHERQIQHQQRWVNHYQNRLIYERAMLDESGGVVTRTQDFEPGGQVFSRGEWLTIIRVNKSNGAVSSVTTPNYSFLGYPANSWRR